MVNFGLQAEQEEKPSKKASRKAAKKTAEDGADCAEKESSEQQVTANDCHCQKTLLNCI